MKESITKFDLEAAFKALDDLDLPVAEKGIKANRPALTEIFSRKSKFDTLFEEYYDISNTEELSDAKEAREAEVAKAKLARIEKIVDLDAETPEELLASYVGKFIIQCPQCMTLFYKNQEDVEASEDDPSTVNVTEVCQHCGNESGYTLVGKVGEATQDETAELNDEESVEVTSTEEDEEENFSDESEEVEGSDETSEEDFDLDAELAELDLDTEEAEEDKKEESFSPNTTEQLLVEQLTEETELDVSPEDFEKLITSSEFKKPISDTSARAMMQEFNDSEEAVQEELKEGIFDKLKSRDAKADWILQNARKDYNNVEFDKNGEVATDDDDRRFSSFVVIGYKGTYTNGKKITMAPTFDNNDLEMGMNNPEFKTKYKDADKVAKGWSMSQGNGPAAIYLIKDKDFSKAVFLCGYFEGELLKNTDMVEKLFTKVKQDLAGRKLMKKGGMDQSITEKIKASELKPGMSLRLEDKSTAEITEIEKSKIGKGFSVSLKLADGTVEKFNLGADFEATVLKGTVKQESLEMVMSQVEELQESVLEALVAESLIESYANVAGFRLSDCSYLNEKLSVNGTIYFTSGATRKTTYTFSEAYNTEENKIQLHGINEKLGLDKQFTITGYTDMSNKTFITESFKCAKKPVLE